MSDNKTKSQQGKSLFSSGRANDWCAGCGDFGILRSIEKTLAGMGLNPDQVAVFGGIGCSGKTPYYLSTYGIHTLHGRLLPFATGAKLARPALTVIAVGGDGDGLSIGAGHLVNAGRRNVDLTYILFDNGVYGLTKGQASPTLRLGEQTKAMTEPSMLEHLNPITLALAAGFTWIGRGYAYNVGQLCELLEQAIRHRGTALLTIQQPCPTYNQLHDKDWYAGKDLDVTTERLYSLQDEAYDPVVPRDAGQAMQEQKMLQCLSAAQQWNSRIPTGVFYQNLSRPCLHDTIKQRHKGYVIADPAEQPVCDKDGRPQARLDAHLKAFSVSVTVDDD
jgi:2-oxoglutarate ferredoxin oxidoreductase subunit beta